MTTKTITHDTPGGPLEATVGEANVLMGMRRQMIMSEALTFLPEKKGKRHVPDEPDELSLYLLRRYTWPNCIASTIASSEALHHEELTFEKFCLLPEQFVSRWEQASLEVNPHWQLQTTDDGKEDEDEKKSEPASSRKSIKKS